MSSRLASAPADSPGPVLLRLFLGDAASAQGAIHRGFAAYDEACAICAKWESDDYRGMAEPGVAAMACALAETEAMAADHALGRFRRGAALRRSRERAFQAQAAVDDRWYFEGRLFAGLPPTRGQDFKKALLALRFLQTAHPDDGSVAYWMARTYERQGNAERAAESYARAAALGFGPALSVSGTRPADPLTYGLRLGVFSSPAMGLGGALAWRDDRLFDSARAANLSGFATTRGQFGIGGTVSDEVIFPPARLHLKADSRSGVEDYYGTGEASELDLVRRELEIGAGVSLGSGARLDIGWRVAGAERTGGNAPPVSVGYRNGPVATLAYDDRDSGIDPTSGARAEAHGYFPTAGLGGGGTMKAWRFRGEWHQPWSLRQGLHLVGGATLVDGDAPYSELPDLASGAGLPGVREFRLRDHNVAGAAVEWRWRPLLPFSVGAFAMVGSAASDAGSLFRTTEAGAGLSWTGHFARYRSASPRLELSYFGGEWLLQGALSAEF